MVVTTSRFGFPNTDVFKIRLKNTADNFPAKTEFDTSGEVGLSQIRCLKSDALHAVRGREIVFDFPTLSSVQCRSRSSGAFIRTIVPLFSGLSLMSSQQSLTSSPGEPTWEVAHLFPDQGHWTETEFFELHSNRMVELADGHLEILPMPTWLHQLMVGFLSGL